MVAAPGIAGAQTQMSPVTAGYQDHANGDKRCQSCAHFQPPTACNIVRGAISPEGSCRFFVAKAGPAAEAGGGARTS